MSAEDLLANHKPGFSNLTHLRLITHVGYAPENGLPCDVTISLYKLQVLEYHHSTPRSVDVLKWSLPSLQRLSIGYLARSEDLQAILRFLALGGLNARRLRSLTLVHPATSFIGPRPSRTIPPSLWTSCPKLEEFAADFEKIIVEVGPPTNATLAYVTDTREDRNPARNDFGILNFVRSFQRTWPSVRKAKFTAARWNDLVHMYATQIYFSTNDSRFSWDRSIELLDAEDLDLSEAFEEVVKEIISSTKRIVHAIPL